MPKIAVELQILCYAFGTAAIFPWYSLAAMHNIAATTANQKDHWNPADKRSVIVMLETKGIGKVLVVNVLVAEPINGILRLNNAWQIMVVATKPIMKNSTAYNGFL